jgi:hypothetical protein
MQLIKATPTARHFLHLNRFKATFPIRTFVSSATSTMPPKDKYTDPELRDEVKEEIHNGDKGGAPGQWSARKAQMMAAEYKKRGGGVRIPLSLSPLHCSPPPRNILTLSALLVHNRQKRPRRISTTPLQMERRRLANKRRLRKRQRLFRNTTPLPPQKSLGKHDRGGKKRNR